jgi:hypothetical protein
MKRNMDLIREVLLALDARPTSEGVRPASLITKAYPSDEVEYVASLLMEAGYITGSYIKPSDIEREHEQPGKSYVTVRNNIQVLSVARLTWRGHEFLDSVRDHTIWGKTKDGAKKIGGASVELMWEIAKAYGKHALKEKLGLEI